MKAGVIGAGRLGKIHLGLLHDLKEYDLVGCFDTNSERNNQMAQKFHFKEFENPFDLFKESDAIFVVTPTTSHYKYAKEAIKQGKHVFIEKPITQTQREAKELMRLAEEARVTVQVGHVERFNPAFQALENYDIDPKFIEGHRLAQFDPRGTDVSVVLDLMIHDLDIVLSMVKANIKRVSANGVAVMSPSVDIANARIEFDNGCVANLTASRVSIKKLRKLRLFQRDAYIGIDFLNKQTEVIQLQNVEGDKNGFLLKTPDGSKGVRVDYPTIESYNAIEAELKDFHHSITKGKVPKVTAEDGYRALELAEHVLKKIRLNSDI